MAKRLALIDADIVAYAAAAGVEDRIVWDDGEVSMNVGDLDEACETAVAMIRKMEKMADASESILAMSCSRSDGWRRKVLPTYKSRRGADPEYREAVKQWLREWFKVIERPTMEADDLLGIMATKPRFEGYSLTQRVIVSDDKDLKQIPTTVIVPRSGEEVVVSHEEGEYLHMMQTLTGDPTDGYTGIPGVGPVAARKILGGIDPALWWTAVLESYGEAGLTEEDALVQARVARILRHGEYDYKTKREILWTPQRC